MISWFFSRNHKTIGRLYFVLSLGSAFIGRGLSLLIRLQLGRAGGFLDRDQFYNVVVTAHAFIIIFFIVIPSLIGGFGNWLIPLILGVVDIRFPRTNNVRF